MKDHHKQIVIDHTRHWVEKAVIGLNLCPFAKAVHSKKQVRYFVSSATDQEQLLHDLVSELKVIVEASPEAIDNSLLIHPNVLTDFLAFNDFLDIADAALAELDLEGIIQVASFHPQYQFANTSPGDMENYSNRSPYPTLHLLRESSVEAAVASVPDVSDIFEKNIETLRKLGLEGWKKLKIQSSDIPTDDSYEN